VTRGNQSGWRQTEPPAWHDHDAGRAAGYGGPGLGDLRQRGGAGRYLDPAASD